MGKFFIILALLVFAASLRAQTKPPHIEWAKCYGGSDAEDALSVSRTSDHGFIIAGASYSIDGDVKGHHDPNNFNSDFWIVKTDSIGTLEWARSIGGDSDDVALSIKEVPGRGYIAAGYSNSNNGDVRGNHGGNDCWIVNLDYNGKIQWQKSYGGSGNDIAHAIEYTSDKGYIVAAESGSADGNVTDNHGASDVWIFKLDSAGNLQWKKSYGGRDEDAGFAIKETSSHDFVIAGYSASSDGDVTDSHGNGDVWLLRIDSAGKLLWQKTFGGAANDEAFALDIATNGDLLISGGTFSAEIPGYQSNEMYYVIRTDSGGNLKWQKAFGAESADIAEAIAATVDGGCIVAGFTQSSEISCNHNAQQGVNDYWVLKLDSAGNLIWQICLGGSSDDYAYSVVQTADSGFVVAGIADSDDGDVIGNKGHENFWVVKLGYAPVNAVASNVSKQESRCFPNPFSQQAEIEFGQVINTPSELIIYNVLGAEVRRMKIGEAAENVIIHRGSLPAGVYIYHRVANGMIIEQGRMMVE